jgi:phosphoribosylanthranilate isomerase
MHLIKICGIRDQQTALECCHLGADAIGLVFFPKSPRHVTLETARQITQVLPDSVMKTGVFVDASFDTIMDTVRACRLTAVQLHGSEPADLVTALKKEQLTVIKAVFTVRPPFLGHAGIYKHANFLLVECGRGNLPGGNAKTWDYAIGPALETGVPVIIAGGLTPDNVKTVLLESRAFGVDVSSGVEKNPGQKDINKIRQFIANVRSP